MNKMDNNECSYGGFPNTRYSARGYDLSHMAGIPLSEMPAGFRRSYVDPAWNRQNLLGRCTRIPDDSGVGSQLSSWSSVQTLTSEYTEFSAATNPQHRPRSGSVSSYQSLDSVQSKEFPLDFKGTSDRQTSSFKHRTDIHSGFQSESQNRHRPRTGTGFSDQSLVSVSSKGLPLAFKGTSDRQTSSFKHRADITSWLESVSQSRHRPRTESEFSGQSQCSVRSKDFPLDFKGTSERDKDLTAKNRLSTTFKRLDQDIVSFVKDQLKSFHKSLASGDCLEWEDDEKQSSREAFLNITTNFLKSMNQEELAEQLHKKSSAPECSRELRRRMQQTFGHVLKRDSTLLDHFDTKLTITHRETLQINQEHTVKLFSGKPTASVDTITYRGIFKNPDQVNRPFVTKGSIRTVVTKGASGIGKTVLTQKFIQDWAEGRANQDIHLLFPFTFRELNLLKDKQFSLVKLLHHCFSESQELCHFEKLQVLFIFDGLNECRFHLDFDQTHLLTDVTECVSVDVLLVNLIRGTLLPSARIWITTRPTEVIEIPTWCISMMTEVQGFTEPQKEKYFRKMFRDKQQGTIVISHIKTSRSLQEMSHIPGFCWILCKVFHCFMEAEATSQLPQTLTEMYIFLLADEAKVVKCNRLSGTTAHWTPETKKMVASLGKLAFDQLQQGNTIFYESDLIECGMDITVASDCVKMFKDIFKEESGLYKDKVYSFISLSVQEFLAAFHVNLTFFNSGDNLLSTPQTSESPEFATNTSQPSHSRSKFRPTKQITVSPESVADFYQSAVDLFLQTTNKPLDLFWRFLFGLSLPKNQNMLAGLFTQTMISAQTKTSTVREIVQHIKEKLGKGLSAEKSWHLLHCLFELQDHSLVEDMQQLLRERCLFLPCLHPFSWSALVFLLMSSQSNRDEFDLREYGASEEALLKLMPVMTVSTKATLSCCSLSLNSCGLLPEVLSSSILKHLDLSNNDFGDFGVELLTSGLKNAPCRLQTLRLSGCLISEVGGNALASALRPAPFHLRELDMRYNHPGRSAELLIALQNDPQSTLDTVRLEPAGQQWMIQGLEKYLYKPTLDLKTANSSLHIKNNTVQHGKILKCPSHSQRFTHHPQVLSSKGLTGCTYWKVDWSGDNYLAIAVSYRGIPREGEHSESMFGENSQSWCMRIIQGQYSFCHNDTQASVHFDQKLCYGRVGVFLDFEAGSLSFYEITSTGELRHLYTFKTKFTEPLYIGFGVYMNSTLTLID